MGKITKLLLSALLLIGGSTNLSAQTKTTLDQLKAANGTDEAWLAAIPTSYPLEVKDNVLFGSDASSQQTNANLKGYDYIYFEVTDFVSARAVRVFFWDPTADKRIDYYLKPIADKETADYTANTTITGNGTYCVAIPVGARLQGAKTPWIAEGATVPYFKFSEIYVTERAATKITLNDLTAANGTTEDWLAAIPSSYPLEVKDNVLFGSDASSQQTNANVNNYDYIYFEVTDFVSERAVRVFFWDPTADKRIDYYLKPIADKETADYSANTTITANGTYCVAIPAGARLQGAKTPWIAEGATVPYFKFSEIYVTERAESYIEATEIIEAPVGTTDAKLLTGSESNWQRTPYPAVLGNNTILFGNGDGSNESTHNSISGFDYMNLYISNVSNGAEFVLRIWIWDGSNVVTLYPHPIAEYESVTDWTAQNKITSAGHYTVKVSGYSHLKGVKSLAYWQGSAGTVTVKDAFMTTKAPATYLPSGKYSLIGDIPGSPSLDAALADVNATSYDATNVTGTGIELVSANPNTMFLANEGALANTSNVIVNGTCANLVLTDGYAFKAPADFTATSATYNTTINAEAEAGTLCLPFAAAIPDGVEAYTLTYTSGDKATATPVETTIPANTPVLLNGSGEKTFTGSGAVVADASNVYGALTGVFAQAYVPQNSYVLQYQDPEVGFFQVAEANSIQINPFRAYLTAEGAGARLAIEFTDEVTGIEEIASANAEGRAFNLAGQRVTNPTKGLYIQNGKKVLVK